VQTLYGHLQSFDVKVGDKVTRGQQVGRSDSTGLAGGDHVHFTQLVGGRMVNPVEWWDPHWIQDRIERKLPDPVSIDREAHQDRTRPKARFRTETTSVCCCSVIPAHIGRQRFSRAACSVSGKSPSE
jgi:hypothetical protein